MAVLHGIYSITDQFFIDFPDPYLKSNKGEHRPHFYFFRDDATELLWMIPMTSQIGKVELAKQKAKEGKTDLFHLTHLDGKDGVLLICDMFPVTEAYIDDEYCVDGIHVVFKDTSEINEIRRKAVKILALLRKGIKFTHTQASIFSIENTLTKNQMTT